ncbi:hypothetical protein ABTN84_18725, partial [Acinetobacter baumannii]
MRQHRQNERLSAPATAPSNDRSHEMFFSKYLAPRRDRRAGVIDNVHAANANRLTISIGKNAGHWS